MEYSAGFKRVFGGFGQRCGGGVRGVCDWVGDARVDLIAFYAMWVYWAAAYFWAGSTNWSDGA
jgi:hypothetical protein